MHGLYCHMLCLDIMVRKLDITENGMSHMVESSIYFGITLHQMYRS